MNELSPEQKMLYSVFGRASESPEDGTLGDLADAIFAGCCEIADAIRENSSQLDSNLREIDSSLCELISAVTMHE